MLSKQAEMAMLNGDFEHFDESGAELLPDKEVTTEADCLLLVFM